MLGMNVPIWRGAHSYTWLMQNHTQVRERTRTQIQDCGARAPSWRTHRHERAVYWYSRWTRWLCFFCLSVSLFTLRLVNVIHWWRCSSAAFNGAEWRWAIIHASPSNCSSPSSAMSIPTVAIWKVQCRLLQFYCEIRVSGFELRALGAVKIKRACSGTKLCNSKQRDFQRGDLESQHREARRH